MILFCASGSRVRTQALIFASGSQAVPHCSLSRGRCPKPGLPKPGDAHEGGDGVGHEPEPEPGAPPEPVPGARRRRRRCQSKRP